MLFHHSSFFSLSYRKRYLFHFKRRKSYNNSVILATVALLKWAILYVHFVSNQVKEDAAGKRVRGRDRLNKLASLFANYLDRGLSLFLLPLRPPNSALVCFLWKLSTLVQRQSPLSKTPLLVPSPAFSSLAFFRFYSFRRLVSEIS